MSETFVEEIKKLLEERPVPKVNWQTHFEAGYKKGVEDAVAVHRLHCKKLAELLKNRPKFEKGMHCESWALNDLEKFFEELEGLVAQKKGDKTK